MWLRLGGSEGMLVVVLGRWKEMDDVGCSCSRLGLAIKLPYRVTLNLINRAIDTTLLLRYAHPAVFGIYLSRHTAQ